MRIPPHYKLKINVQLWKIQTWDNELMQVFVDGFLWETKWAYAAGASICGAGKDNWHEKLYNVEILVPHNSPSALFILTSTLNEGADNEAWGFRDFHLSYLPCPGDCGICSEPDPRTCSFWK
jgi:hypothetical protein